MDAFVMVTCEHGGHLVPPELRRLYRGQAGLLRSHRGWDPGALGVARELAELLGAPLLATRVSRLVVECNRTPGAPGFFSPITAALPEGERARLIDSHWRPLREAARALVLGQAALGCAVVHLSVHSFTPVLDGQRRTMDAGILFDPDRHWEARLAEGWRARLAASTGFSVLPNEPYLGTDDGHTTALRQETSATQYAGIEVELRQDRLRSQRDRARWARALSESFRASLSEAPPPGEASAKKI